MREIANFVDGLNERIGRAVSWLALAIVLVQFLIVVGRYVFGVGSIWMQELVIYMFGFTFMLGAAYALRHDGHVRVDIFYREAAPRTKALVNLLGSVFFLLPMCVLIFWIAWPYVFQSWSIWEGSTEASGIPARYLQKTAILVFAVLMGLQGLAIIIRSVLTLRGDETETKALRSAE
ncbi:TRAP transporter small permease subunit [Microbaculum marinisediminis]|uniref:TRAP transporter small permease protein n=1 Tax=Microbaculum marinisediminis TaxID=2931392 RepID=A0AAW5QYX3_9HYPH|nr:TRAP transporter small permease subunit [Microbaculum sp. A6E488]MCT8971608.1 TRAP transporter small permease subunit [Microbaculum sp. A6E488]